jgi:hypothetical protein
MVMRVVLKLGLLLSLVVVGSFRYPSIEDKHVLVVIFLAFVDRRFLFRFFHYFVVSRHSFLTF